MRFQFVSMAGVVLISTLILATGMYIYSSSQTTFQNTMIGTSRQEIEALDSNFMLYEGLQKGSQVRDLIQKLISNAEFYEEEPEKIPSVKYVTSIFDDTDARDWQESDDGGKITSKEDDTEWQEKYSDALLTLLVDIDYSHPYFIKINTDDNGLVSEVIIRYDNKNLENDNIDDNSNGGYDDIESMNTQEIEAFNSSFMKYEG